MPTIEIDLKRGRTTEQKRTLVRDLTATVCSVLGVHPAGVRIILRELTPEHYAVGGELWLDHPEPFRDNIRYGSPPAT
ncbi:MAG: 2-hydroxymuconate tautomerase family protein [bacterium]|nr:2-hydroxymuconate tautomerase family protein [bacterium]